MHYIQLFLASSITEFHALRYDLGNSIRMLNDELIHRDRYVQLVICEDVSNAVSGTRKQDDYNAAIRASQLFLILCGSRIGGYTLEEFNVACQQRQQTGAPAIHAAQMVLPGIPEPDDSARSFMQLSGERGIPVHRYDSPDALKQVLRELLLAMF